MRISLLAKLDSTETGELYGKSFFLTIKQYIIREFLQDPARFPESTHARILNIHLGKELHGLGDLTNKIGDGIRIPFKNDQPNADRSEMFLQVAR